MIYHIISAFFVLAAGGLILYADRASFKRLKNPTATRGQVFENMSGLEKGLCILGLLFLVIAYLVSRLS